MDRALIHWYWKMNWNWCFHSSAAGRVSSGEGDFDKLTTMNYAPNIGMQNWTRKIPEKGKSGTRKGEKFVFLCLPPSSYDLSQSCRVVAHPGRGIATRSPFSKSGAQSVSRWFLWNSTGYGSSKYVPKSHFRLPGNGNGRRGWTPEQRDWLQRETFNVHHSSSLAARPTTQHL